MAVKADWPGLLALLSAVLMVGVVPTSTYVQLARTDCLIPNWHVDAINVTYSPGSASLVLSNSLTNKTEALTCPLTFNSVCQIMGTPNDETLQVVLQVNIDVATMTLNQS